MNSYLTLAGNGEATFRDRGSRFLAFAFEVTTEEQIRNELTQLRRKHPSANHHCYAWRLGADQLRYRLNDDGEPSGTAGRPIFGVIQQQDLTNVLIVVVRYFGGSLLGVKGLIDAYRTAAAEAVNTAGVREQALICRYRAEFDASELSSVMRVLKECHCTVEKNEYTEKCEMEFVVNRENSERMEERIRNLYKVKLVFLTLAT